MDFGLDFLREKGKIIFVEVLQGVGHVLVYGWIEEADGVEFGWGDCGEAENIRGQAKRV